MKSFKESYKSGMGVDQPDKSTPAHSAKDDSNESDHIGMTMVGRQGVRRHHQAGVLVGEDKGGVPIDGDEKYLGDNAKD